MTTAANTAAPRALDTAAILVAAGSSTRMRLPGQSTAPRKPWLELGGRPLLAHVVDAFEAAPSIAELIVVAHADDVERVLELESRRPLVVVPGGATRAASVRAGLAAIRGDATLVAIHDAARPLIAPGLVERVLERA
ncbi:MAG: 2-C-methyl-D-erythritol 4-phosphate cytidylyltransferase, partial [Planctomycetota bacterium]